MALCWYLPCPLTVVAPLTPRQIPTSLLSADSGVVGLDALACSSPLPSSGHLPLTSASSCLGEELIYLDPHTTQPAVELTDSCFIPDESFHCQHPPCRMGIGELDPSIAVVCPDGADS